MMIESVTMYKVNCDGCGESAEEGSDYFAWADASQAVDQAINGDWLETDDGKHYCPNCIEWDDEADEMRPKAVGREIADAD